MAFCSSYELSVPYDTEQEPITISTFPAGSQLTNLEQIRRFELLRLAFFVLKLRKLEARHTQGCDWEDEDEYALRCNLLQHAIFQQVLTLTALDAREQALQLIANSRPDGHKGHISSPQ
jgi:hypothetical protein